MKHIKLFEGFNTNNKGVNNILNESWQDNPEYDKYFNELVADSGKSDTVEGEMLRAISKIVYRYYNDGDVYYKGYGKETAGGAYKYLVEASPLKKELKPLFVAARFGGDAGYEENLEKLVNVILDYIKGKNGSYEKNDIDMLDFSL